MSDSVSQYLGELRRRIPILLLIAFAAAAFAYGIARRIDPTYEVHYSYIVSLSERENPQEYTFDGYYALQATDLFAATLARWAQTPEVVVASFKEAQLPLTTTQPYELSKIVRADKTAPQLVQVTVTGATERDALALSNGLQRVMEMNIERYEEEGIPALRFRVSATDSWVGSTSVSVPIITSATFLLFLFLGFNTILFLTALRVKE